MEFALAMVSFAALVVSWFVLPSGPPAEATTISAGERLPTAA